jgi:1-acyl-sn-glycerol-3-phosphate acyltransferase
VLTLAWFAIGFVLRPAKSTADGAERIHRFCARVLRALGVIWSVSGKPLAAGAVVSNHLSYIDILVFAATQPFVMVAKSEVRHWPLIGWFTRQAGTVYVVRGGGSATYPAVNAAMAEAFRSGYPVLFFPEGTTTDGSHLLSFRRGLLHSVLKEDVPLQAAAVGYSDRSACWWGDALLVPHLLQLAAMDGLRTEVHFGGVVGDRRDRFTLAESARDHVAGLSAKLSSDPVSCAHQPELTKPLEDLFDRPVESVGAFDSHGCVLR